MSGVCEYYRLDEVGSIIMRVCQALGFSVLLLKNRAQEVCQKEASCCYKPKKKEVHYR